MTDRYCYTCHTYGCPDCGRPKSSDVGSCLGFLLLTAILCFMTWGVIPDYLSTRDDAESSCATGVRYINGVFTMRDLVSFDVICVGSDKKVRIN